MARRGRPPKPIHRHILEGTYEPGRHARRAEVEPVAPGHLRELEPPDFLSEGQRRHWQHVVDCAPNALLAPADAGIVLVYARAADAHERAIAAQNRLDANAPLPFMWRGRGGKAEISPYLDVIDRTAAVMLRAAQELGLTPTARARIGVAAAQPPGPQQPDDVHDPWRMFEVIAGGKHDGGDGR